MRPHAERVYGRWDADAARIRFEALSDPPPHSIIELDGEAIGVQWVRRHPDGLELVQLYLLPDVHNRKIGTQLVTRLLDHADRESLPVRLAF